MVQEQSPKRLLDVRGRFYELLTHCIAPDTVIKALSSRRFVRPPSTDDLEKRLRGRGTETEESLQKRLASAQAEIDYANTGAFDKIVINEVEDTAFEYVRSIRDDDDYVGDDGALGELSEQDRLLPIANVARIMKSALPDNSKISKEAKECVQECVSEFIAFVTSEASDRCQLEKRKTINGDDILWAMQSLGFDNYNETLKLYLQKYREANRSERNASAGADGQLDGDMAMQGKMNAAEFNAVSLHMYEQQQHQQLQQGQPSTMHAHPHQFQGQQLLQSHPALNPHYGDNNSSQQFFGAP
ncbi:hypothetical protein HK405_006094 [Cladochytrium tenue]|nr:hypothetical protein HK405_006094 [Cladochytrium tenue]